jgi:hypothetical protein
MAIGRERSEPFSGIPFKNHLYWNFRAVSLASILTMGFPIVLNLPSMLLDQRSQHRET